MNDSTEQPGRGPSQLEALERLLAQHRQHLERSGWHIEVGAHSLSVHRIRKNGAPLKSADVALEYWRFNVEGVFDNETGEVRDVVAGERARPWTIRAKGRTTTTVKHLDAAAAVFLEWADNLAPNREQR